MCHRLPPGHARRDGLAVLKSTIEVDQRHYPETLHRFFIVNAPFILKAVWRLVKPWLDPHTQTKIQVGSRRVVRNAPPCLRGGGRRRAGGSVGSSVDASRRSVRWFRRSSQVGGRFRGFSSVGAVGSR
jgi:hypothetical protein